MKNCAIEKHDAIESAESNYRKYVFAAADAAGTPTPDREILNAANRLPSDFAADVARRRRRMAAIEIRDVTIPAMEREAEELAAKARAVATPGGRPLSDFANVAELHFALQEFKNSANPNWQSDEQHAAHAARMSLRSIIAENGRELAETADPEILAEIAGLRKNIEAIMRRISARPTAAKIDAELNGARAECELLANGNVPARYLSSNDLRPAKTLWSEMKVRIKQLLSMREAAADAEKQSDADRAEIGKIEKKISVLIERLNAPENMRWSEP